MSNTATAKISKMLYQLGTENRASANKTLNEIIDLKVRKTFATEYEKVKSNFSKENR